MNFLICCPNHSNELLFDLLIIKKESKRLKRKMEKRHEKNRTEKIINENLQRGTLSLRVLEKGRKTSVWKQVCSKELQNPVTKK